MVIGNGNVALDVARMLALLGEELAVTDIADHALEPLRDQAPWRRSWCSAAVARPRRRSPTRSCVSSPTWSWPT